MDGDGQVSGRVGDGDGAMMTMGGMVTMVSGDRCTIR